MQGSRCLTSFLRGQCARTCCMCTRLLSSERVLHELRNETYTNNSQHTVMLFQTNLNVLSRITATTSLIIYFWPPIHDHLNYLTYHMKVVYLKRVGMLSLHERLTSELVVQSLLCQATYFYYFIVLTHVGMIKRQDDLLRPNMIYLTASKNIVCLIQQN